MKKNKIKVTDYKIEIVYSSQDDCFVASIPELPHTMANGDTEEEALKNVLNAGELWLETAKKENITIPEPISMKNFSGKMIIRLPIETHRKIAYKAKENHISINQYILSKLA